MSYKKDCSGKSCNETELKSLKSAIFCVVRAAFFVIEKEHQELDNSNLIKHTLPIMLRTSLVR